jgi:hypothetical protein
MKKILIPLFVLIIFVIVSGCKKSPTSGPSSSSNPGKVWSLSTNNANFSPRDSHSSVVFNNKMWVIGGDNHTTNQYTKSFCQMLFMEQSNASS